MFKSGDFVTIQGGGNCPVSGVTNGMTGVVECVHEDEDGDMAALVWFGERVVGLRSDSAWIYFDRLAPAVKKQV